MVEEVRRGRGAVVIERGLRRGGISGGRQLEEWIFSRGDRELG